MLELLHVVITSLLLSAAMGCGTDPAAAGDEEPANNETGVDVGEMPKQLALLREPRPQPDAQRQHDRYPTAFAGIPDGFCEPTLAAFNHHVAFLSASPQSLPFPTAGRSP